MKYRMKLLQYGSKGIIGSKSLCRHLCQVEQRFIVRRMARPFGLFGQVRILWSLPGAAQGRGLHEQADSRGKGGIGSQRFRLFGQAGLGRGDAPISINLSTKNKRLSNIFWWINTLPFAWVATTKNTLSKPVAKCRESWKTRRGIIKINITNTKENSKK